MKHSVRINGGLYRGRKLHFPDVDGLRPTPDRVKITLFNWLMQEIKESRCLDAFAGSGALGFEAFSRGASHVDLVETSPDAFKALKKTADLLPAGRLRLHHQDACQFLTRVTQPYDIIFLDPPFAGNLLEKSLDIIFKGECLKPGGFLYVESSKPVVTDNPHWTLHKAKQASRVFYSLFRFDFA